MNKQHFPLTKQVKYFIIVVVVGLATFSNLQSACIGEPILVSVGIFVEGRRMKICKDGRIWGQNNKEAGIHLGKTAGKKHCKENYIKKGYNMNSAFPKGKSFSGKECSNWRGGKIKRICGICKDSFYRNLYEIKKGLDEFCYQKCMSKGRTGKRSPNWLGGLSFKSYGVEFNERLKEQIRERDNHKCQECFRHQGELRTKTNRPYKLHVHHINYIKTDNRPENLISLCVKCHLKANRNRKYWTKHFQDYGKFQ